MYTATCKSHACGQEIEVQFELPPTEEDKLGYYCDDCAARADSETEAK